MFNRAKRGYCRGRVAGACPRAVSGWRSIAAAQSVGCERCEHPGIHGGVLYQPWTKHANGRSPSSRHAVIARELSAPLSLGPFLIDLSLIHISEPTRLLSI